MGVITSYSAVRLWARDFVGCHCSGDAADPGDWAVRLCGRPFGLLWLTGLAVMVGVASGSSNERARRGAVVVCPGVVRIEHKRHALARAMTSAQAHSRNRMS